MRPAFEWSSGGCSRRIRFSIPLTRRCEIPPGSSAFEKSAKQPNSLTRARLRPENIRAGKSWSWIFPTPAAIAAIFERLAYRPVFRYEKFRTEYGQRGSSGIATVDETPIGVYLELEGEPSWIDSTARKLGFAEKDYITASYARLYMEWCQARGIAPADMLFA